jgi:hypothetical protein
MSTYATSSIMPIQVLPNVDQDIFLAESVMLFPCVACHSPHAAQKNYPVVIDGEGKLNTAIRRPSHYKSTNSADLLWGDDANERMSSYASSVGGTYQAPYYADTTSGRYEPDGSLVEPSGGWGSNTPDYVTFCMDCHQYAQYDPERGTSVDVIKWGPPWCSADDADRHGAYPSNTCSVSGFPEGTLKAPYVDSPESNYVLSCLDCHEPHATHTRLHLIRRMINGGAVAGDASPCDEDGGTDWPTICEKCHDWSHSGSCNDAACHGDIADYIGMSKMHGSIRAPSVDCPSTPMF